VAGTSATRSLLAGGVVAGPLFIVVGLLQAFTREGFDLRRHPLSLLSNGDLGWIQVATFVVTGLLFAGAAVGMRRVLHPGRGGTWGPLLVGAVGVGMIAAGVFVADPADEPALLEFVNQQLGPRFRGWVREAAALAGPSAN